MSALTPSLTTPNLPRCLTFYVEELGFACTSEMRGDHGITWVELTLGDARLMLLAAEEPAASDARYDGSGVIFYLEVDDLSSRRDALIHAGRDVSRIEVTFYGMREVYVKDPDGRQLTLAEPSEPGDAVTVREL
jgi:uncharacterized glyoxalase superfamily protein PhnB